MRIASYLTPDNRPAFGPVRDGQVQAVTNLPDLRAALAAGGEFETGPAYDLSDIILLPPVTNPDKIICIGLNYLTHIKETGRDRPSHPPIFTRYPSSLTGHGQPLIRPAISDWFDFEGELAVVIGTPGRNIAEENAMQHVVGYTCFNDGSIRDFQRHTSQFWPGKNFDASGSMGPWLVTADEIPDPTTLTMETRLNGAVMQSTPISDLAFTIPQLIAYVSTITRLLPGDVIATGTPGGVGLFREPKLFMKPGDTIEVEIPGIGTLSNPVASEA